MAWRGSGVRVPSAPPNTQASGCAGVPSRGGRHRRPWTIHVAPVPGVTVVRMAGHFDGAAELHWPAGSENRGALLTGDTITVVQDRDWVTFMWRYPNLIPLWTQPPSRTSPAAWRAWGSTGLPRLAGT